MPVYLIGEGAGGVPFNRVFFNATLGSILERIGKSQSVKLTLYFVDGTTLEATEFQELADSFMVVKGFAGGGEENQTVNVVPYGLIYRIQLAPRESHDRIGFHWVPPAQKGKK